MHRPMHARNMCVHVEYLHVVSQLSVCSVSVIFLNGPGWFGFVVLLCVVDDADVGI